MGTYEEEVVDRSVDAAWLQLRVRLADHLAALPVGHAFSLVVDRHAGAYSTHIVLSKRTDETQVQVKQDVTGSLKRYSAPGFSRAGFRGGALRVDNAEVDAIALAITSLLRDALAVVHPAFVEVHDPAGLVLVDPPRQLVAPRPPTAFDGEMPTVVEPGSYDELCDWVDRVLLPMAQDGERERGAFIPLRGKGVQAWVRVATTDPVVEVWAHLASGIDLAKAHARLAGLAAEHRYFRFLIQKDRLYAVATVQAAPFAPRHLTRTAMRAAALSRTLGPELTRELAPHETVRKAPRVPAPRPIRVDPVLTAMLTATDLDAAGLVALAVTLSDRDADQLDRWKNIAARSYAMSARACEVAENADELELGRLHYRAKCRWQRVMRALGDAMDAAQVQESAS
ncbi:hypothetical protein C6I20_07930 [Aeromicrobium sp. A1-2]|nr:hypothetical protein C6I20_07930 [Aeromicrobium sp. A1-2]